MPFSRQPLSFTDVLGALSKAVDSEHGVSVECANHGSAIRLRHRMNSARKMDRDRSTKIYPPDHPMYGNSPYDILVIRLKQIDQAWHVVIEKSTPDTLTVVPLGPPTQQGD